MNSNLKTWHFTVHSDALVDLVIEGRKTATTTIYDGTLENVGTESILIYENEKKICITKTVRNIVCRFDEVDWTLAELEGENTDLEDWRRSHYDYFKSIRPDFSDDTLVLVRVFEVVRNLKQERLDLGRLIAENNKDILGEIDTVEEVNAGFNNSIFNINQKYIIKVCGNPEKEALFDTEAAFYTENKDSALIPKLYRFDDSKRIVPYVYEIIEKVNGLSVYYFWYKWTEEEREAFIKKLMESLTDIHVFKDVKDDWKDRVKGEITGLYQKCIELFSEEEKDILTRSFMLYDKVLLDNHYALIHNDLHFDNILLDKEGNIKLIDFNDSMIAPFDFDLRILFMCQDRPWKWANIEMDPLQKPEDYRQIRSYIKKYYVKLSVVRYLDERMYIYEILNDIRHLPRYKSRELIDNIVAQSRKLIEANP